MRGSQLLMPTQQKCKQQTGMGVSVVVAAASPLRLRWPLNWPSASPSSSTRHIHTIQAMTGMVMGDASDVDVDGG